MFQPLQPSMHPNFLIRIKVACHILALINFQSCTCDHETLRTKRISLCWSRHWRRANRLHFWDASFIEQQHQILGCIFYWTTSASWIIASYIEHTTSSFLTSHNLPPRRKGKRKYFLYDDTLVSFSRLRWKIFSYRLWLKLYLNNSHCGFKWLN